MFSTTTTPPSRSLQEKARTAGGPSSNVELIRARLQGGWVPPVAQLVGFTLTEIDLDRAVITLEAGPQHANPMNTLHGGILCDIADAAMGMAYVSSISPEESFTTVELKMNFLRPVWNANLTAEGRVVKRGRRLGLVACRITDEQGDLVAFATSTCMTIEGTPGEGIKRPTRER